jgi:hypothetical protein
MQFSKISSHVGRAADAHFFLEFADLEAREGLLDHERADAVRSLRGIGHREDADHVGDAALGDPDLVAVEHVGVAALLGAGAHRARRVGTAAGFGQRVGGDVLARGELGDVLGLLLLAAGDDDRQGAEFLNRDHQAARSARFRDFFDHLDVGLEREAEAAVFGRERNAEQVVVREQLVDVAGEFAVLVDRRGARSDLLPTRSRTTSRIIASSSEEATACGGTARAMFVISRLDGEAQSSVAREATPGRGAPTRVFSAVTLI